MTRKLAIPALMIGLALSVAPAYAQTTDQATKQNAAIASGPRGAVAVPADGNKSVMANPGNPSPAVPRSGVSGEATAAGGAR